VITAEGERAVRGRAVEGDIDKVLDAGRSGGINEPRVLRNPVGGLRRRDHEHGGNPVERGPDSVGVVERRARSCRAR
jgi:hypothetical protein